ncbi:helix-turn-helix domain containing protein [Sulfitobacter sp. G21635-S1]|uniref:TetR/AcrR family transcriptional regulator n=1 Tax=Sulfitobacter sp. G21635-S1 TaxID=3014043 RepID=UPI0022AE84A2|nr:TetR/AcrR family transcriptional regulator [Sulfitobacter sp. G21635-S1]MCZ4257181.1 helix-turn-helix domain containing protein [Sulfitobacter sp. G21635-S1]
MPKRVDHEAYSRALAGRAAAYFSAHGYAGTGMRQIADHLGVSKSALYHYFPNKEALFLACTRQIMAGLDSGLVDPGASEQENLDRLLEVMRVNFGAEMALVFDYLRGKTRAEIAQDEAMQMAMESYRALVERIVGQARAEETLARLLGTLLLEYCSGK